MKILSFSRTVRLMGRLEQEAIDYYRTLHDAKAGVIGLCECGSAIDYGTVFSDLTRWKHRLKRRFMVMAIIAPTDKLSEVFDLSDFVLGWGALEVELEEVNFSYRS